MTMPHEELMARGEQRALFREWEEDYALRKEEDANRRLALPDSATAREAPPAAGPPHPWPSEIAGATRQPQPDRQRARENDNGRDTGHSM
jgi:hypothetical protein